MFGASSVIDAEGSPACAGIGPWAGKHSQVSSGFPRLRGDRPEIKDHLTDLYEVPPPARG